MRRFRWQLERAHRSVHLPITPISRFGMADQSKLLDYCLRPRAVGRRFVEQVRSDEEDYFVLKPRHSASLEVLLTYLGASFFVLCGLATKQLHRLYGSRLRSVRLFGIDDRAGAQTSDWTHQDHDGCDHHFLNFPSSRRPIEETRQCVEKSQRQELGDGSREANPSNADIADNSLGATVVRSEGKPI